MFELTGKTALVTDQLIIGRREQFFLILCFIGTRRGRLFHQAYQTNAEHIQEYQRPGHYPDSSSR